MRLAFLTARQGVDEFGLVARYAQTLGVPQHTWPGGNDRGLRRGVAIVWRLILAKLSGV